MITFHNGHRLDFACASGALGFDGLGYWWEKPLRWLGVIDPKEITIISKTLTARPRRGNLRWCCPWRCVSLAAGGAVNAVGLTNPGLDWWLDQVAPHIKKNGLKMIASIAPESVTEAREMAMNLNEASIVGVQVNVSCPNTAGVSLDQAVWMVREVRDHSRHPVLVKLGYVDRFVDLSLELQRLGGIAAVELINTVPWSVVFPGVPSPLARYGLQGGVSGPAIQSHARAALSEAMAKGVRLPIVSGGGISCVEEVMFRKRLGARAFTLGTIFLRRPWAVRGLVREARRLLQE